MTYVSKGEKIFALSHGIFAECTPPKVKRSDGRLKRFSSIFDDRIWSLNEKQRYRYLYDTMGGSRTCLTVSTCFQYIPLEEIINIILADRDAYIKCLEKKLGLGASKEEIPIDELYKACHFEDEEELDVMSMKNKIGALTAELEECRNTRDTLRQAMHKLENIDEIINENECLKKRLRCSEEIIKYLEEKKSKLEKELENVRTKSQIQVDLENAKETLKQTIQKEQLAKGEDLVLLARERDNLQRRVCELQHELNAAKSKQSELELFKRQSQSTTLSLEEITKENECYKKKLASMTCLEKQIQELKKQASVLAEKYKRACDQDRKMKNISSELQSLREERDRLKRRVDELACYEYQYNSFQCKLQRIDVIIAENEMLNCKLASLDKLEIENQYLRCKLDQCQSSEFEAAESREKIIELQNAVADQEKEMKDLLCQIDQLTRAFENNGELDCLKEQLCEKDCKLKLCEEQLAEIPLLEAEIDELRSKLENCCNNIGEQVKKASESEKSEVEELMGSDESFDIAEGRYEDVDIEMEPPMYQDIRENEAFVREKTDGEKGSMMSCEEIQSLLQSSKGIINCVLEDMIEHQREMEELEKCNQEMRKEICLLKAKMGKTDMDECLQQLEKLRRVIEEKELKICCLETQILRYGDVGKVNDHINDLECEIEYLKDLNKQMRSDLEEACREIKRCSELDSFADERQTRKDFANQAESRKSTKSQKEEFNLEAKVSSGASINEVDALKTEVKELKELVEEFKKENSALREMQTICPDFLREMDEKEALENLLNLLQCELDSCRQGKIENDCENLKLELNRLEKQNCQLKSLVNCYKERLDLERTSKEAVGSSNSSYLQEENKRLRSEITRLRCELVELCKRIQQNEKTICEQENEMEKLKLCCNDLVNRNEELEAELDEKDNESQTLKGEVSKLLDQTYRLSSDNDVLKNRLNEAKAPHSEVPTEDYEEDLNEKHALESTMRNFEEEVDGLKMKLEECSKFELEKNDLLKKQADMTAEMEMLRKQLAECKGDDVKLPSESKPAPPFSSTDTPPPPSNLSEVKPAALPSEYKAPAESKEKEEKLLEEKERLYEQTNKLQAEVNEAKTENKKLKNEVDELRKQLDQCNKEKAYEPENKKLRNEVDELRKQLDQCYKEKAYEPENKKLKNEVDELRKQLDQCNKEKAYEPENKKLRNEVDELRKQLDQCNKEKAYEPENKKLKNEVDELRKQLDQCNKEKAYEPENKKLRNEVDELRKQLDQCNKEKAYEPENKKLRNEVDQLRKQLDQCNKEKAYEPENQKLKNEVDELKKLLDQCSKEKAYEPENKKLRNEVDELRKQLDQCNKEKAYEPENKKLKNEVDELRKQLDQCNKEKAHEAAQASLMSSKLQAVSYPVPAQAQGVPQTVIPIKEEQRTSVYERGTPSDVTQATQGAKVAFIESQAPKTLVKVVADAEDFKKPKEEKPKAEIPAKTKPNENVPLQAALKTSKTGVTSLGKAPVASASKAPTATSSSAPVVSPSKAPGVFPLKPTVETPSKAPVLTPSKVVTDSLPTESKILKDHFVESLAPNAKKMKTEDLSLTVASDESVISFSDIDPNFAKFLCRLNPDNHKQNICEIERRYKEKMCEVQRKHDEKMKMLVEQHQKEAKLRDGIYNDNVNNMRSSYETDIRKLVEKHKASILRLQSLHEDEIQQLNMNYEAEIEAIETQNDNMLNDLTSGAREKFKALAEQHNKEIKELERKYQELLERKENELAVELSKLKSNKSEKIDRVEEYHKKRMSDMTMALGGNISDIQTRHDREFQKLKKSNLKRIDILKNKYEGLLMCERKKYEKQLEDMVQRLRQGKASTSKLNRLMSKALADGICQCRFTVSCDPKDPNAPLEFNDVIQKILREGLESLTFNEVALVHKRTCAATEEILIKSEVKAELEPSIKDDSCKRNELLKMNKEEVLSRITGLENEIAVKQMETQDAIVNMERAVKAERKRLQDLREFLRSEHGKFSDVVLSVPKIERDVKSAMDLQCMPDREKSAIQKMDQIEKERLPLILVPEKENAKILHIREPQPEGRKRKTRSDDCKPKHGGTTKKKLKK